MTNPNYYDKPQLLRLTIMTHDYDPHDYDSHDYDSHNYDPHNYDSQDMVSPNCGHHDGTILYPLYSLICKHRTSINNSLLYI